MEDEMATVEAVDHEATNRTWTDTGKRNASVTGFEVFTKERGLGSLDPKLVQKRWENLVHKYKELKKPRTGVSTSVTPPALFASYSWEVAGTPPLAVVTPLPVVRNASGASSTVSTPKRRRVDTVELAELIKESERRFSETWTEMKEKQRRAVEARVSEAREAAERGERRHREALEREEGRHREMVALEERRFNFLRESGERREREAAARERETAAREERREREAAAREERREREAAAREERLLTLLEKMSAHK